MSQTPQTLSLDQYDTALLSNLCPPNWVNPQPTGCYDLVILGAGPAGQTAADAAAARGARVALVEDKRIGGDSLHGGSVPSRCLARAARAYHDVYESGRFGIRLCQDIDEDFPAVMARLRQVRSHLGLSGAARRFRSIGVDLYLGRGTFRGTHQIEVGGASLTFRKALIATGSRPAVPAIEGLDRVECLTTETVFSLSRQPRRLAVIGAGASGCELAQSFCRLGSEVTLIDRAARVLPDADPDASRLLGSALQRDDVNLCLGAIVSHIREVDAEKVVHFRRDGESSAFSTDEVLLCTGRAASVDGLGLAAASVQYDAAQGVNVDDTLRTSNRDIFAAGDVCSSHRSRHAAEAMARLVVENALFAGRRRLSDLVIPRCAHTDPQVVQTGLTCQQAAQRGIRLDTYSVPFHLVDRAIIDAEDNGLLKIHTHKGTGRIAGATIVARQAAEMIGEIVLAMTHGLGLDRLAETLHPYPAQAEAIRRAAVLYTNSHPIPRMKRLLALLPIRRR